MGSHSLAFVHFANNLENLKKATIYWAQQKEALWWPRAKKSWGDIQSMYDYEGGGFANNLF